MIDQDSHVETLIYFLTIKKRITSQKATRISPDAADRNEWEMTDDESEAARSTISEGFKNARLFEVDEEVYRHVHGESKRIIDDLVERKKTTPSGLCHMAPPDLDTLPFAQCFVAVSPPMDLAVDFADASFPGKLIGYLMTTDGLMLVSSVNIQGYNTLTCSPIYFRSTSYPRWFSPQANYGPVVTIALLNLINERKSIVEQIGRVSQDMLYRKASKLIGEKVPRPLDYYVVNVSDRYIEEHRREIFPPRKIEWLYRWDVRGHDVLRVKRGPLPLAQATRESLEKRRYKIFALDEPDAESCKLLMQHRMAAKRADEWVAVLSYRRRGYVKGPADKPYVPSTHRVSPRSDP